MKTVVYRREDGSLFRTLSNQCMVIYETVNTIQGHLVFHSDAYLVRTPVNFGRIVRHESFLRHAIERLFSGVSRP